LTIHKVKSRDIAIFLRQLATLISAGISIVQSFEILEKSQEKISVQKLICDIKREILTGKGLFHCLQQQKPLFDELTCQLIQIGENTGKLDSMLRMIATHQEKNIAAKLRIQQALFYPCIIIFIAITVSFSMFIFIIPQFAELFQETQVKLPLLTLWIFSISNFLNQNMIYLLLVGVISFIIIMCSRIKSHFFHLIKYIVIQCSPLKRCFQKIILARFARTLAITFSAGIPIDHALKLAASPSHHIEFTDTVAKLRSKICTGVQLHQAMFCSPYFPSLMIQMIKIGEESGMLEQMLDKTADFFEADSDQLIARLNQLLEPLIMLILGAVIGGIVIGMYLPIFKLGSAL
jgi:type IV pilus assembly protein PilC